MFSYFEPNFIEKFLWEKWFFQIMDKIKMTRNKNLLFGRHFETVQHFLIFFSEIIIFDSSYTYGTYFIAKFLWESGFLHATPLGTNGSKSTLVT